MHGLSKMIIWWTHSRLGKYTQTEFVSDSSPNLSKGSFWVIWIRRCEELLTKCAESHSVLNELGKKILANFKLILMHETAGFKNKRKLLKGTRFHLRNRNQMQSCRRAGSQSSNNMYKEGLGIWVSSVVWLPTFKLHQQNIIFRSIEVVIPLLIRSFIKSLSHSGHNTSRIQSK